jgi:hypothetical protein
MAKEVLEMEVKSNIGDVAKDTEKLDGATKKASKGFKGMGTAIKGVGMALKAAGIGLVVALFVALQEALGRNQKVMNAVNTVMTTVSTTFNQVADVLVDVYDWVTKSSDRFDGLTKVIGGLITIALTPLKLTFYAIKLGVQSAMLAWEDSFLGGGDAGKIAELRVSIKETANDIKEVTVASLEAGKQVWNNLGDAIGEIGAIGEMAIDGISKISIKSNYEQAKATTAAANSSKLAEAQIQGLIEKYDRQAELQRQIRDDETKTFAERIAANKKLGEILDEQETEMLKLADTRVAAAALELSANESNIDLQVAYQQALNDRAGVEAQVSGFRSEQLTNEVSLNKELLESQKEIRAEGLAGMEQELQELQDAYDLKVEMARKAGMDTTAITTKYQKEQLNITKRINDAKLASQLSLVSAMGGTIKALGGLFEEGTAASKAAALAEIAINTGLGMVQGLDIAQKSAKAAGPGAVVAFPIFFATQIAAVLGAAAQAKTILGAGGGGGGGGGGDLSAPAPSTPAPQMMSGAFDISGGVAPEATKAYVVTDEMSNSQNQLANIRRRATI